MKSTIFRQLIVLPLLAAVMATLYACGAANSRAVATPAHFTTVYVLRQGASAAITGAAAKPSASIGASAPVVRLERVNDSRCHPGAVCVWAGYISFSFTLLQPDGSASNFVLSDNMPNGTASVTRSGLTFTLAGFQPQQVPAKNEAPPDYQVSLKVSNINPP